MEPNQMRDMMTQSFGDEKADKSTELNASMSIQNTQSDEYTREIMNMGGNNSGN